MKRLFFYIVVLLLLLAGCESQMNNSKEVEQQKALEVKSPLGAESDGKEQTQDINDKTSDTEQRITEGPDASGSAGENEGSNETDVAEDISAEDAIKFAISEIGEEMGIHMTGKSFHENPHIQLKDLRYVEVGYIGFDGKPHQGAIIVNEKIAQDILEIFTELYEAAYPIERMEPIDAYEGSDHDSMVANNTSGFNYRVVAGTDKLSNHAYGMAVDINPLINPWVTSGGKTDPVEGAKYADRSLEVQGMIHKGDVCYEAFVSRGFTRGGDWKNSKDYQHFDLK